MGIRLAKGDTVNNLDVHTRAPTIRPSTPCHGYSCTLVVRSSFFARAALHVCTLAPTARVNKPMCDHFDDHLAGEPSECGQSLNPTLLHIFTVPHMSQQGAQALRGHAYYTGDKKFGNEKVAKTGGEVVGQACKLGLRLGCVGAPCNPCHLNALK